MSRRIAFAFALALVACGDSEPGWQKALRPRAQRAVEAHGDAIAAVLPQLPAAGAMTPMACAGPEPALPRVLDPLMQQSVATVSLPVISRELAERFDNAPPRVFPSGTEFYGELASSLYGLVFPRSMQNPAEMVARLEGVRFVGVFVTEERLPGKVDYNARRILAPSSYRGWLAVLDLAERRVVARLRIEATSGEMVMISDRSDLDLFEALNHSLWRATTAALVAACPAQ